MLKTTREQLENLKALEAQATPAPWACGDATGKMHWAGKESIVGVIGAATDRQVAILCSANYNFRECIENMPVIAESRNALDALLHDAAVAHRLVAGIHTVINDLRAQIMAEFPHPSEEYRRNNDHLEGWITGARQIAYDLEALLSAAKGAE